MVRAGGLTPARRTGRGATSVAARRRRALVVFLAPAFLLYTIFIFYPLLNAFGYSLFAWRGTIRTAFTGIQNYVEVLAQPDLLRAFLHSCLLFVGMMLVQNTAGLAFALFLHSFIRRGKQFFQTVFALPYMVSPIVVGYLWSLLLSPSFGAVNGVLESIGLDALTVAWLGNPTTALPTAILVKAWQWVGFPMLLFGAALAGIPAEYGESARVDGAGSWTVFRRITFPLLLPAIGLVGILTFIDAFNVFDLMYALGGAQGAPAGATDVLGLILYRTAFESNDVNSIGLSSALAVTMFAFVFSVAIAANLLLRRREARLR